MELWKEHNYKNVELRIEGHTDPNDCIGGTKGEVMKVSSEFRSFISQSKQGV
jgi:hypothetical protein